MFKFSMTDSSIATWSKLCMSDGYVLWYYDLNWKKIEDWNLYVYAVTSKPESCDM